MLGEEEDGGLRVTGGSFHTHIATYDRVLLLLSVVDHSPGHGHVVAKLHLNLLVAHLQVTGDLRSQP